MSPNLKRKLSSAARDVSPPPTRRKTTFPATNDAGGEVNNNSICNAFTIFSWNVNGISPLLQKPLSFDKLAEYPLREFLKRHQWPQLLCLQEVKISSKDVATQRAVHMAANAGAVRDEPEYDVWSALPRDKYNAIGFGGKIHGVATLVRSDVTTPPIDASLYDGTDRKGVRTTTKDVPWDLEGRVLVTLLPDDTTGRKLAIINGYWVNGTDNPYRDPVNGTVTGTRHDQKLRFHQNMLRECQRLEKEGYQVVLIGDMNIAPVRIDGHPNLRTSPVQHVKNRADFNSKFMGEEGWGIDVFRALHGSKRKYTYHPKRGVWGESGDRVDLVVAARNLMNGDAPAIIGCDIEDSPEERGHSDHVPLWVSIDLERLVARSREAQEEWDSEFRKQEDSTSL